MSSIQELRAKLAAQKANKPATQLINTTKIEESKKEEVPVVQSVAEESILQISEDMHTLEDFDPVAFVHKLKAVREGVEAKAPGIANYLQEINRNLVKYPELLHILTDEQIGAVVSGLLAHTNTNMSELVVRGKTKKSLTVEEMAALF